MIRKLALIPVLAAAAFAQSNPSRDLKFWFNGIGLAMHTESSTANSPLSTAGSISVRDGHDAHRVVLDAKDNPVFAYDIDIARTSSGRVALSIRPVDQARLRAENWFPKTNFSGDVPTLAAPREFPALAPGDAVQVDILFNPSSGEKLWDVLRVLNEPNPPMQAPPKLPSSERFSFDRVKITIDGKTIADHRNTWMIGQAMLMRVPGHGEYYMLLNPTPDFPFKASGWVDRDTLRFTAGNEKIEIAGKSNLLQKTEYGNVWIYHVPEAQVKTKSTSIDFTCADTMEQLLRP